MYTQSTDSVQIHYQVEGLPENPVMLMVHGFYGSLQDWYDYGYVAALIPYFRLVMVDARGHGLSGKPSNPEAYTQFQRAMDVLCVLNEVGCKHAFYYGYSMGAWIAYRLMDLAPDRISSYILTANHPFAQEISHWKEDILNMENWVPQLGITPDHKQRFLKNDRIALIAACAVNRDDSSRYLLAHPGRHLFLYGSADPIKTRLSPLMTSLQENEFVELEGLDHVGCLTRSDKILPIIQSYFQVGNS